MENFNESLARDSYYTYAYKGRAMVYSALGQYEQALNDLNKTLEIDPKDIDGYRKRSQLYQKMGRQIEADSDNDMIKKLSICH